MLILLLAGCGGKELAIDAGVDACGSFVAYGGQPGAPCPGDSSSYDGGADTDASASLCSLSPDCGTASMSTCLSNGCPGNGACILAFPKGTSDRGTPGKCTVQSCIPTCSSSSDCPSGTECANPSAAPWDAFVVDLDNDQAELVCLPNACASP
jgi:hypothetical protein